jgi:ferredoxin
MAHNLKVEVDKNVCIGSSQCEHLAPTVFMLGEDGVAIVLDPSSVDEEMLLLAERSCPSAAIRLINPAQA